MALAKSQFQKDSSLVYKMGIYAYNQGVRLGGRGRELFTFKLCCTVLNSYECILLLQFKM